MRYFPTATVCLKDRLIILNAAMLSVATAPKIIRLIVMGLVGGLGAAAFCEGGGVGVGVASCWGGGDGVVEKAGS